MLRGNDKAMTDSATGKNNRYALVLIVLVIIPVVFHLAFSWLGYNPNDDRFSIALNRRTLDGQIPQRKCISVRSSPVAFCTLRKSGCFGIIEV